MAQFKEGDVVRLKSGGPKMTIEWVEPDKCLCKWFEGVSKPHSETFSLDMLELADSPKPK